MFLLAKVSLNFSSNFPGYSSESNGLANYLQFLVAYLSEDKSLWFSYWVVAGDYSLVLGIKKSFYITKQKYAIHESVLGRWMGYRCGWKGKEHEIKQGDYWN